MNSQCLDILAANGQVRSDYAHRINRCNCSKRVTGRLSGATGPYTHSHLPVISHPFVGTGVGAHMLGSSDSNVACELYVSITGPFFLRAYEREEMKRAVRDAAKASPPP
jgi:hypothetical protein